MNLISGIANSGIFAQSAYSAGNATNDGLGRNISETYLTGIPDEYATKDYVDSGLSDKYDTSSFSAISADFLIRSGIEYENGLITGYDGSAFKDTQYSAGDNIVIDNDTISVNSSITLMHPNTLRTLNLDGNEAQFVDVSGDAGCIIEPSGMYVSDLNQTEFTIIDKDHVNIRDASGLISIENTGRGPSVYLSRHNGNYDSTVQMYAQNHQYQKYRSYIELTDHDSATSSYNQLDLNTVDITLSHTTDDNDPALNRYYSFTGACNSASSALNILNSSDLTYYSAGDFIDITDHVISVTDTAEAESMGIGEGLYIDNSGNLCASATGGADYSAGDHIDITDDTISVTGIEETDSLGLGEHLYIDASGNIDVSATETDSMGIGEGLYLDASGNLCASATGSGPEYSAGAFIDITDNVISVTDTAEASGLGIGDNLYIDDSGNLCASGIPQSANEAIDAVTANSAQWAQSGTEYSATAPLYIDSGNIGISAKDFNLTAPLVMTEDDSAVNITVSAKDFNLTAPLVMSEDASSVNITVSSKDMEVAAPLYLTEDNSAVTLGISGILYESGFGYDSNSAISGYNGSAFAGGGGGGISTVTTDSSMTGNGSVASPLGISYPLVPSNNESTATFNQYGMSINDGNGMRGVSYESIGRWDETHDTVSANSGAWGGSALPISAGAGMSFSIVDDTLVINNTASTLPQSAINAVNVVTGSSGNWNNTYSAVTANSATWSSGNYSGASGINVSNEIISLDNPIGIVAGDGIAIEVSGDSATISNSAIGNTVPDSTGTYILKCIDGVIQWVLEA